MAAFCFERGIQSQPRMSWLYLCFFFLYQQGVKFADSWFCGPDHKLAVLYMCSTSLFYKYDSWHFIAYLYLIFRGCLNNKWNFMCLPIFIDGLFYFILFFDIAPQVQVRFPLFSMHFLWLSDWDFLIQICDAIAVAKILNATLVTPAFHLNSVWRDSR